MILVIVRAARNQAKQLFRSFNTPVRKLKPQEEKQLALAWLSRPGAHGVGEEVKPVG